jgi:hypothetical protein
MKLLQVKRARAGMRIRLMASCACAVLLATAVTACGGGGSSDNGVASKSPNDIVSAVNGAVAGVTSVHVSGSVATGGVPVSLNMHLVSGKGGTGSMAENGLSFQIISVGNNVYINASQAFWQHFAGSAAAALLNGKWLKAPASGQFASLAQLTDLQSFFNQLLSNHGTLSKGATSTVNGQKVVAVTDTTHGGTLYVATTGKPYPVEIVKPGAQGGRIYFDQFNQSVTLTPPAGAIDISQLGGG